MSRLAEYLPLIWLVFIVVSVCAALVWQFQEDIKYRERNVEKKEEPSTTSCTLTGLTQVNRSRSRIECFFNVFDECFVCRISRTLNVPVRPVVKHRDHFAFLRSIVRHLLPLVAVIVYLTASQAQGATGPLPVAWLVAKAETVTCPNGRSYTLPDGERIRCEDFDRYFELISLHDVKGARKLLLPH